MAGGRAMMKTFSHTHHNGGVFSETCRHRLLFQVDSVRRQWDLLDGLPNHTTSNNAGKMPTPPGYTSAAFRQVLKSQVMTMMIVKCNANNTAGSRNMEGRGKCLDGFNARFCIIPVVRDTTGNIVLIAKRLRKNACKQVA